MTSTPCDAHVRGDGAVIPDKARDKLFRAIRNNRPTNFRVADGNLEQHVVAQGDVQADTMSPRAVSTRTTR